MGRRSRKRTLAPGEPRPEAPAAPEVAPHRPTPAMSRRPRLDEAPKAPWSPFPLVELCILIGLALMITGFATGGNRGGLFVVCGVGLVGVASLELAIREHFAGYRSHSSLLALASGIATMALLGIGVGISREAAAGGGVGVFVAAFLTLRAAFRLRPGGLA